MADVWEGQVPVAFVVLRQTPDLDVLRQYVGKTRKSAPRVLWLTGFCQMIWVN